MSEKILYILGAGASVNALPLARTVWYDPVNKAGGLNGAKIRGLAYDLANFDWTKIPDGLDEDEQRIMNGLDRKFKDLGKKADEFGDVDTYAKYLHLMNQEGSELKDLKKTLAIYFGINQKLASASDSRYLPWLVSIMNRKTFPENVKILSWNYDFQVQLASIQVGGGIEDVKHAGSGFTYGPGMITHFPSLDPSFSDFSLLSLIHLNGIAGYFRGDELRTAAVFQKQYQKLEAINSLLLEKNGMQPHLHFAWERGDHHSKLMSHVFGMIDRTTIVVIIGYSFPFFNREIDKQVFVKLTEQGSKFRKIYYQDPVLNGQQLKAQFGLRGNFDIVHIEKTDNFHIPFEY